MDDIVSLGIKIESLQAEVAANRMNRLANEGSRAERSALSMGAAFKVAAAGAVLMGGAIYKILEKTSEFQVLNANLVTATGSLEGANKAFSALKTLATTTPFTLQEVTTAFTKLVNYGLTPSERAIRSYGDTAAAMGKPITSLVEGVADAVNGEFERVKESFNVKAKNLGDTVAFRFRGVTTEVKNNAKDIEEYFIKLGETNFAGGMARQMDTLKGKASNLQDAWDLMLNALGSNGLSDLAMDGLSGVTEQLNDITAWAESGKLQIALDIVKENVSGQIPQWQSLGSTIYKTLSDGAILLGGFVAQADPDSEEWDRYWSDVFNNFPTHIEYMIKLASIQFDGFLSKSAAWAEEFKKDWSESNIGRDMGWALSDWMARDLKGADLDAYNKRKAEAGYGQGSQVPGVASPPLPGETFGTFTPGAVPDGTESDTIEQINVRIQEQIDALNTDTDAAKRNTEAHVERSNKLLDAYNSIGGEDGMVLPPKGGAKTEGDPLAGFKVGGGDSSPGASKGGKSSGGGAKAQAVSGGKLQAEYEAELLKTIYEKEAHNELEVLAQSEERVKQSYDRRRAEILSNTDLTEQQKLDLIKRTDQQLADFQTDAARKRNESQLKLASDFYGNLATVAGAFGKKGHKAAQAFAIAKTLMDTYSSATASYNSLASIPYVGPALGAAAASAAIAMGYANIQKIRSTEYTGAYTEGGVIPGNSTKGDRLSARVNSGEMILNQRQQRHLFDMANGGSGESSAQNSNGSPWRVVVHNNAAGHTAEVREDRDARLIEITIGKTIDRIAAEADRGNGKVDRAMQRNFKLKRA